MPGPGPFGDAWAFRVGVGHRASRRSGCRRSSTTATSGSSAGPPDPAGVDVLDQPPAPAVEHPRRRPLPPRQRRRRGAMGCSILDRTRCLLPFPNDLLTLADPTTDTGSGSCSSPTWVPGTAAGRGVRPDRVEPPGRVQPRARRSCCTPAASTSTSPASPPLDRHRRRRSTTTRRSSSSTPTTGERVALLGRARRQRRPTDAERALVIRPAAQPARRPHATPSASRDMSRRDGRRRSPPVGFRIFRDDLRRPMPPGDEDRVGPASSSPSPALGARRHRPRRPPPGVGLHGRQHRATWPSAWSTCATTPSAAAWTATSRRSPSPGRPAPPDDGIARGSRAPSQVPRYLTGTGPARHRG